MSDQRSKADALSNLPEGQQKVDQLQDLEFEEQLKEMAGYRSENDQGLGVISENEVEQTGNFTPTDLYQGETSDDLDLQEPDVEYDLLTTDNLREGETNDVMEAIEGGLTYVPPIDPAVQSGDDFVDDLDVVNGFALSADQEGNEVVASLAQQVHIHLLRDSATSRLARQIRVRELRPGTIELSGSISDYTDEEMILGVVDSVEGVQEIKNKLKVA